MHVNEQVWGEEFWEIGTGTINCRSNVTEKTDTDYDNFPPFISNKVPDVADTDYPCSLFQHVENNLMELNTEIDKSICYVGFEGGALSDIAAWHYDEWHIGDPWLYTDPTDNKSTYMMVDGYMDKSIATPSMGTSTGTVWSSSYSTAQLGLFNRYINWSPDAITGGDLSTSANQKLINRNLRLSPYRSWGLRSIYLVINVAYLTNSPTDGGSTNPTFSKTTLHSYYADHTDTWRNTHPILGAWAIPYSRISKSGGYSNTQTSGTVYNRGNHTTSVSIVNELHDGDGIRYDYRFATNYNVTMGYFPLFGYVGLGHPDVTSIPVSSDTTACPLYMGMRTAANITKKASTNRVCWAELDGNAEGTYDYLMTCCAFYGLYFADGTYSLASTGQDETRWTDPNMCLPIISDEGYTDGSYTKGAYNVTNPAYEWKDTSQSPYNPAHPPTPTMSYDSTTTFNDISNIATLTRRYALTKQDVEDLGSELWQISSDIINNIQNDEWYKYTADVMDTFLVTDPLSCIVSLQKYPLTIPEQSGPVNIKLGKAETSISANITKATAKTYYFTPVKILPRFGNSFMDYEPYTHFELYVPFCGTTELDPRDILGRTLSINLVVDFNTGTCVAYVLSDSLVIETINGSLAIDIPVTGVDSTTIASNITQGIINTRNARYTHQFGTLGKVASPSGIVSNIGNVWGSAQSILTSENNAKLSEYELTHQPAQPHVIGSASPVGSWAIDFKCRLLIYYPTGGIVDESKVADSSYPTAFDNTVFEQYQSQIGFATVEPVSALGASYAHTLVCAEKAILNNVTTPNGRPATEPELQLIRQALQEGVILP